MCTHVSSVVHKYTFKYKYFHKNRDEHRHKCTLRQKKVFFGNGWRLFLEHLRPRFRDLSSKLRQLHPRRHTTNESKSERSSIKLSVLCWGASQTSHINSSGISGKNMIIVIWIISMTSRPPGGDDGVAKIAAKARSYIDLFSDLSNYLILALQVL